MKVNETARCAAAAPRGYTIAPALGVALNGA